MHPVFVEALLLRSVKYGEADIVATLLTPTMGSVGALARGARKSLKRFGAALDFFNLLRAEIKPSRAGMPALLSVELVRSFSRPRDDMEAYAAAHHLLEVSNLATRENDTAPEIFALLRGTLEALEAGGDAKSLARAFEIRAISILGYSLGGGQCAHCGGELSGAASYLDFTPMCASCAGGRGVALSAGARKTLVAAQTARPGQLRISQVLSEELGAVVDGALARALGARPKTSLKGY